MDLICGWQVSTRKQLIAFDVGVDPDLHHNYCQRCYRIGHKLRQRVPRALLPRSSSALGLQAAQWAPPALPSTALGNTPSRVGCHDGCIVTPEVTRGPLEPASNNNQRIVLCGSS